MNINAAHQATMPNSTRENFEDKHSTRFQVKLGPKAKKRLEYYKGRIEPSTNTEVFRASLMLFDDIMKHMDAGDEFLVRDKEGNTYPYRFLIDID